MKGSLRILHGLNTAGRSYCWVDDSFTLRKYRRTEPGMGSLQILTVHSIGVERRCVSRELRFTDRWIDAFTMRT